MIITSIETFPLRIPFKPGNRSAASAWGPKGQHAVDSLLVKVTTDQGLEGWGESFGFTGVPVTQRAIDAVIAPLCVGQDATRIGPLMGEVQDKLAVFGRGGPFTHAVSAVDIALWDIAGKAAGTPLHRLLGGGRDDLACYAIHATAALGTADSMIEWRYFDLEAKVLGDALTAKDGRVLVPQGPGLGIDPDPDVISAYLLKNQASPGPGGSRSATVGTSTAPRPRSLPDGQATENSVEGPEPGPSR